jgi:hypothetical protein
MKDLKNKTVLITGAGRGIEWFGGHGQIYGKKIANHRRIQ